MSTRYNAKAAASDVVGGSVSPPFALTRQMRLDEDAGYTDNILTLASGESKRLGFFTDSGEPGLEGWTLGGAWSGALFVKQTDASLSYDVSVWIANAAGNIYQDIYQSGTLNFTGTHTFSILDLFTRNFSPTDRVALVVHVTRVIAKGTVSFIVETGPDRGYVVAPWDRVRPQTFEGAESGLVIPRGAASSVGVVGVGSAFRMKAAAQAMGLSASGRALTLDAAAQALGMQATGQALTRRGAGAAVGVAGASGSAQGQNKAKAGGI